MKKLKLMLKENLTIKELIEKVKLKGEYIPSEKDSVFGIPKNKYIERGIFFYEESYWVIYSILDNHILKCYWEDMDEYLNLNEAKKGFDKLVELQNKN